MKAKLGSGKRFASLEHKLEGKGVRDPGALAATIGREKYGKARFQSLAAKSRRRAAGSKAVSGMAAQLRKKGGGY